MDPKSHVDHLLSAFMDGELPDAQAQAVREHLTHCDACQQQLAALTAADELVRDVDAIEPSAGFERTFWNKVAEMETRQANRWWTRLNLTTWRPALAMGLVAGIAMGLFVMRMQEEGVSLEDRFMADNVELLNDFDLIHDLEILENWEVLEAMEELS